MQVTIHAAKTNLSKLIELAKAGEEVVIAKGKIPVARIVPIPQANFTIGLLRDRIDAGSPDFFEPMDDDDLAAWEAKA